MGVFKTERTALWLLWEGNACRACSLTREEVPGRRAEVPWRCSDGAVDRHGCSPRSSVLVSVLPTALSNVRAGG